MDEGSPEHGRIIANAAVGLRARLRGTWSRVYDSNLRVRDRRTTLYTYPDLTVICGPREFDPKDERRQTVLNPKVVVEVLSPSTEGDDRGEKFDRYRDIESLELYVLVSQATPRVATFERREDGAWLLRVFTGPEAVAKLEPLGIELPLAEVFQGFKFPPPAVQETREFVQE